MQFIKKFQEGGATPAPDAAAPQQGGEDPTAMLLQGAQQAVQGQDCEMAMQVCQAFVQIAQQMQGGGTPAEEQGEPVFAKKGAKLIRRIKK